MFGLFGPHPYHNRYSLGAIVAGITVFGMMLLVLGAYELNSVWEFTEIDVNTYNLTKLIMMSLVLFMGVYAISQNAVMEGAVMVLGGIYIIVFSASELMGVVGGLDVMNVLFGGGIAIVSITFFARKDYAMMFGTASLGLGMMAYPFLGNGSHIYFGILSLTAGTCFLAHGLSAWYGICSDVEKYPWQNDEICNRSKDAVGTAGFLIMGILSVIVGLYYLNNNLNLMTMEYVPYNIVKTLLAAMILYYAAIAFRGGALTSGMMSLFFGASTFTFSVSALLESTGGVVIMDAVFGIGMMLACIISIKEKQISSAVVGFLVFSAFSVYPFFSGDIIYYMVGIPILLVGFIMTFNSCRYIYRLEIDRYGD